MTTFFRFRPFTHSTDPPDVTLQHEVMEDSLVDEAHINMGIAGSCEVCLNCVDLEWPIPKSGDQLDSAGNVE